MLASPHFNHDLKYDNTQVMAETQLAMVADRVEFLRGTPLLGRAPPALLLSFAEAMDEVALEPGATVIKQGDTGEFLFVLTKGNVEVHLRACVCARLRRGRAGAGEWHVRGAGLLIVADEPSCLTPSSLLMSSASQTPN